MQLAMDLIFLIVVFGLGVYAGVTLKTLKDD